MSDLDKLIEAVEGGEPNEVQIFAKRISSIARDRGECWPSHDVEKAHKGSLDAAKALHEALLPGWGWYRVNDRMGVELGLNSHFSHRDSSPARAWLLSILKAYRAQQENAS